MDKGLYIHVPFCLKKCPYCDFYSVDYGKDLAFRYALALRRNLQQVKQYRFNTVFFGGGTPVLLWEAFPRLLSCMSLSEDVEITVEANPGCVDSAVLQALLKAGVNRISFGVQSLQDTELKALGRLHTAKEAKEAVLLAKECGFQNISVDLMLGISGQTKHSLLDTIRELSELPITHVSAYLLKIEPDTPYGKHPPVLPPEEEVAQLYLLAAEELEKSGFFQYEISNFAKEGYRCRHNLKYWHCDEYLGIGPAAHSYWNGTRFEVPRNLEKFLTSEKQETIINDENPGDFSERVMLGLRLTEGISLSELCSYLGSETELKKRLKRIPPAFYRIQNDRIALTRQGFLLSNRIIGTLLFQ